jgi:macrolide-specific efflux system membrane fusion protein
MAFDIDSSIARASATAGHARSPLRPWRTLVTKIVGRSRLFIGAFALLLLIAAIYAMLHRQAAESAAYATAPATIGDIEDSVTALGNLQPRDYVDVGAQATGQLKKLYVDIGSTVKQGQLLAEIDPQVASAKVAQDEGNLANLKAQLADREAQLSLASSNFARQKRLKIADATSKADYDAAKQSAGSAAAEVNALKGQIAAAQSQLDGDKVTLGYTKIYAPMSGTVVSISIKQGQTINSVQQEPTILRIADLKTMTVWTQVSEADVPKLKLGMAAYFTTLGNPDKRWYGRLAKIQPMATITNNVVLYTATFDVANSDNELMTQMTAQVFFVTASAHDVVTVPISALHKGRGRAGGRIGSWAPKQEQDPAAQSSAARYEGLRASRQADGAGGRGSSKRYWVAVMRPDGSIERRFVRVGVINRVSAEILSGIRPGESVVTGRLASAAAAHDRWGAARNGRPGYGPRPPFGGIP